MPHWSTWPTLCNYAKTRMRLWNLWHLADKKVVRDILLPVPGIPLPSGGYGPRLWLITKDNNWDSLIPWFKYCARIPRGTIIKFIKLFLFNLLVVWKVTLLVTFGFLNKILGGSRDLYMLFCHSMTAGWVVRTLGGGVIKKLNFLHSQVMDVKTFHSCSHFHSYQSHLVKLSLFFCKNVPGLKKNSQRKRSASTVITKCTLKWL